ncbi:MAG: oligosaccharide flippase family protein [Planctomycetaceae bacterium]|nr:oligosaccharide flippase family protein [Planctomycetaceae bacterium]
MRPAIPEGRLRDAGLRGYERFMGLAVGMKTSTRITLNTATNWAYSGLRALIQLAMVPFLLEKLGTSGYGIIGLVGVIVSSTELLDMGLRSGLGRHLAFEIARKDYRRFNELASTGLATYLILGSLFASACIILARPIAALFKVPPELVNQAVFLIRVYGGLSILVYFLQPVFNATIIGENRFDIRNYLDMGYTVVQGGLLFAVLGLTSYGLMGYTLVSSGTLVLSLLARVWAAKRLWPSMRLSPRFVRLDAFKPMLSLGSKLFVFHLTRFISIRSDPIIITRFFGPAGVALYTPGLSLPAMADQIIGGFRGQLETVATRFHAVGEKARLHALLIRGTKYTLLMGIAACVILGVFAHSIIKVWLGRRLGESYQITAWFMVGWSVVYLASYAAGTQWAVLMAVNRMNFITKLNVASGIINVLASIYLAGFTPLGVLGVIIPTAILANITRPIVSIHTARVCGLPVRRYFWEAYARPLVVLVILAAIGLALRFAVNPQTLLSLAACVAAVALAWLPLCWWVGFDKEDKKRFGGIADGIRKKIGLSPRNGRVPADSPPQTPSPAGTADDEESDLPC